MSYTIPPDTRAVGTGNPPQDMNDVSDVLTGNSPVVFNVLNTAWAGGADPTGANDSTAAIQAALNAVPAQGGIVCLPSGTYKVSSTLTNAVTPTYIRGDGRWATLINFTGTGDCLRMYNPAGSGTTFGGGVTGLTIDGTNAGNSSTGLHAGDGSNYEWDMVVQNFTGTGSIGVHFDNTIWWTEKMHGTVYTSNCTQHVVFDVSGADTSTNSFGYMDLHIWVNASASQDGVVLQNGAQIYHSALAIRGNFTNGSTAQTTYALRLTGTVPAGHPASGGGSKIIRSRLDITVETSAGAHGPGTIYFGTSAVNVIEGCYGVLDFGNGGGSFSQSNLGIATNPDTLWYQGFVNGDGNLNPGAITLPLSVGGQLYSQSIASGSDGDVFVASGDFFAATLSADITVNLNAATNFNAPRRITIIYTQAASGGPYTVTWPHSGSPSDLSPTVLWAGGSAPTMSTGAGAVDVYDLETVNGATWIGRATQNVS